MDPLLLVQSSVMGRLHQLIAVTLLFIGNGHLVILQGLSRSLQLMPAPVLNLQSVAGAVAAGVSQLFLSAVQITAPILAALLIADIALGLLTRAAPALNAFALAFPLKILLSLLLIGLVLTQLPGALASYVQQAATTMLRLSGG
jgi:flagellar biosynthesis protein FliR